MSLLKHSTRKLSTLKKSKSKSIEIDYTAQDLPSLRRKRTIAYKRLTKALEVGILAANDTTQRDLFLSYHQEVKQIAANFEDAHFTIQEVLDDPENEDNEIQERFDEMYYRVLSIHRNLARTEATNSHRGSSSSNIRLPKIVLPTFSGDIKKWPEYFDTFNALIHNSTSITDTEKFHYLLSSLSGDALTVVKPFPKTHEHYLDAYQALTARYRNKRDLAFTCWRDILNVDFKCNDAHEFRKSLDLFEENLSILKTINLPIHQWDFVLVYHILSKLDTKLRRDFEEKHSGIELSTYTHLKVFLQSKCEALMRDDHFIESNKSIKLSQKLTPSQPQPKRNTTLHTLVAATPKPVAQAPAIDHKQTGSTTSASYTSKCSFCSDFHSIAVCSEFLKKSLDDRMKIASERNWCFNCLKPSHQLKDCKSIFTCRACKRKHHTLLHRDKSIESNQTVSSSLVSRSPTHTTVLLATAIVQVKDSSGAMQSFRALFDTGSQSNFITESALKRLNLHPTQANVNVSGLGQAVASTLGGVTCAVGTNNEVLLNLDLQVISTICGDQPIAKLNTSGWSHIQSLPLADPGFDIPGSIDLLFAADVFADSLLNQHVKGHANQPTAFNSIFGWLLLGKTSSEFNTVPNSSVQPFCDLAPQAKASLPSQGSLTGSVSLDNSEPSSLKVLGLKSDPTTDAFLVEIKSSDRPCEKRFILSEFARVFDPLGFLSPITIKITSHIQKLWIIGIGWDQTPPDEVNSTWTNSKDQRPHLTQFRITRKLTCFESKSCELHGFCGSSETAYGAVLYLRVTDKDGTAHVYLVCSNARVAPLKRTSLPRLELCAAVLLSNLHQYVRDIYSTRIKINAVYLWSDSIVVLSWLPSHSSPWATLIVNSQIQELMSISSGNNPPEIIHNSLWWAGHYWLSQNHTWRLDLDSINHDDEMIIKTEERKAVTLVTGQVNQSVDDEPIIENLLKRFSSLSKLVNVLSYIYRFINNSRNPNQANRKQFLNNVERHHALMHIVKYVQNRAFTDEITQLKSKKTLSKHFRKLNPFLDDQGVLRVGGRISRSGLEYEHKHPAFLPSDHPLTFLIIDFIHRNYLHPGINTTHFLLLQQFWIIAAKRTIRRRLSKCIQCFRTHPQPLQPFMSDLPSYRVNQVKPFSVVGVDLGGPFRIKLGSHRGAKTDKAYLCLFVCLSTKAVHLEVVSTLSTEGFIAALRRFVGRRGRCNVIHADCGTNFVGAKNQLSHLMQQASSAEKIEFKFNPPGAPHFGGVWEIQIKAAKSHLYRVVGDQVLTFEELTTLFVQIEAILNSRPLCPISSDPNDLSCLTPGHFLTLEPLTAVPDEDLSNINLNRLHRWQLLQAFQQNFWSRWKTEYLNSLTQRAKWTKDSKPLSIGSMVIIKDDNRPPLHWTLARVIELQYGGDGIARSALVKNANNHIINRPLVKLCPLPIED